jgi:DNA-binding NarL/FixJ family response regulator
VSSYRVVLADDHLIFRQGIKRIIEDAEGIRVVGEAGDGIALLNVLKHIEADLVILDISMPKLRGIEATREAKKIQPDLKILILSMHKNQDHFYHAISAGADGYLIKDDSDTELFSAIEKIRKDEFYLSPLLSIDYEDKWFDIIKRSFAQSDGSLSTREIEVLKLIAEGRSSRDIAELLFVSKRTIDAHRVNIIKKLRLKTIADLTRYAIGKGYISNPV